MSLLVEVNKLLQLSAFKFLIINHFKFQIMLLDFLSALVSIALLISFLRLVSHKDAWY